MKSQTSNQVKTDEKETMRRHSKHILTFFSAIFGYRHHLTILVRIYGDWILLDLVRVLLIWSGFGQFGLIQSGLIRSDLVFKKLSQPLSMTLMKQLESLLQQLPWEWEQISRGYTVSPTMDLPVILNRTYKNLKVLEEILKSSSYVSWQAASSLCT